MKDIKEDLVIIFVFKSESVRNIAYDKNCAANVNLPDSNFKFTIQVIKKETETTGSKSNTVKEAENFITLGKH